MRAIEGNSCDTQQYHNMPPLVEAHEKIPKKPRKELDR